MPDPVIHPASFRDPSGFIFQWNGAFYRQVNRSYSGDYDMLMSSGLYDSLVPSGLLIPHTESSEVIADENNFYKTLKPLKIPTITFPYEWCFDQLKDAALLTLRILRICIDHGMIIKDATPYNIQFINGKPVFIDTLSFEAYDTAKPWVAYRQFCNMFLFPLYLEHYLKADIQKTLIVYPDGIPVDITSRLLPLRSRKSLGVWLHVYLQNTVSSGTAAKRETEKFSTAKLLNLVEHLETTIAKLKSRHQRSAWNNYYEETISGNNYLAEKEKIVAELSASLQRCNALDLGANDGHFSRLLASRGFNVISVDSDSRTIGKLYSEVKESGIENILPLVIDIANPTPSLGFRNMERESFHQRVKVDLVLALALIHHMVIGRNITLPLLAEWLNDISRVLMIEFVPRDDEKVIQMLASRKDVFQDYTQERFESVFTRYFNIVQKKPIPGSPRTIYLMEKR